ncbi:MAG: sensor histidine kinase [Clostridium sp.]
MKSIKSKLIKNFFIVIFSTIVILDVLLMVFVRKYYYDNTEELLKSQIEVSTNFYNKHFSASTLMDNIYENLDSFWNQSSAQVEILDSDGNLIMDSIGVRDESILRTSDIEKALKGQSGRWVGNVNYYENKIMIVSQPIMVDGEVLGIIRFITSLKDVDGTINTILIFFFTISVLVLAIGILFSIIIANGIINPIKSLTKVAEKMAGGNLKIRSSIEDNDEIGKLAMTFNYMAEELEKREQLKNEFISSVSHELRTPLTAIKGWAITLNDENTDKETLKVGFDIIANETDRLSDMVEELLGFSRLLNGEITLRKTKIDLDIFIKHIETYMGPRATREGLTFEVNILEKLGFIYIDRDRFKQVLINILDNAFKFTENLGVVILTANKVKDKIIIEIKDSGCGISREDLPKVKEKFFKGRNSKSQNGIGLSICDEIIRLHNGIFTIKSEINIGTVVEIIIPITNDEVQ